MAPETISAESLLHVRVLAVLYVLVIVIVAPLLSLATHLQPEVDPESPITLAYNTFHLFTNGLSVLFSIYFFVTLWRGRKTTLPPKSTFNKTDKEVPTILKKALPISRFQKIGVWGFGLVALTLDGMRLVEVMIYDYALGCVGSVALAAVVLRFIFIISSIILLSQYDTVILNTNIAMMKRGFLHMIATNLAGWITMVILEAYEGFLHTSETHHSTHTNSTSHESESESELCETSLSNKAGSYMFPFIIEFVLLGAAIFYKIFEQIAMPVTDTIINRKMITRKAQMAAMGTKFRILSVLTSLIFLATLGGTIYSMLNNGDKHTTEEKRRATYVYYSMEITLNVFGIITILFASYFTVRVPFTGHSHSALDEGVLIATLFGFYLAFGFKILPSIESINASGFLGDVAQLETTNAIIGYIQASLQFIFITDALRRGKSKSEKIIGPVTVVLLFNINLSLWLVASFLAKGTSQNSIMVDFYGQLVWNIALYVSLPLAVFFRFHSSVCLGDILIDIWYPDLYD